MYDDYGKRYDYTRQIGRACTSCDHSKIVTIMNGLVQFENYNTILSVYFTFLSEKNGLVIKTKHGHGRVRRIIVRT